ncbi:MAG TPA: hypothetical protein PKW14_08440 [Bacteroidota bacterium]|nr:hypothetical protein [Bacteroidota bacterium]
MGDLKKMLQEANNVITSAENTILNGKNSVAVELIKKAEELGKEIFQSIPSDPGVKSLFQKIEKLKKDLERKGIIFNESISYNLPFEAQSWISNIKNLLAFATQQPHLLDQAKSELKSFLSKFPGILPTIPEIKEIQIQIDKIEKDLKESTLFEKGEKIKEKNKVYDDEKFCNLWYQKLKEIPFFDGESNNLSNLLDQKEHYFKAFELIKEFDSQNFIGEKTLELEKLENDIRTRIKNFQEKFNNSIKSIINQYKQEIIDKINILKNDTSQTPVYLNKNEINDLRSKLDELKKAFEPPAVPQELLDLFTNLMDLNESKKTVQKAI